MGSGNIVSMVPTVVFQRRSEISVRRTVTISTTLPAVFFKQCSDFLDKICLVFQLIGQTCIGFSECCHYTTIRSSGRSQVCEFFGGFIEIFSRLYYIIICIPGGCSCFPAYFSVLLVGRAKVYLEIVPSLVCFHFFIPSAAITV